MRVPLERTGEEGWRRHSRPGDKPRNLLVRRNAYSSRRGVQHWDCGEDSVVLAAWAIGPCDRNLAMFSPEGQLAQAQNAKSRGKEECRDGDGRNTVPSEKRKEGTSDVQAKKKPPFHRRCNKFNNPAAGFRVSANASHPHAATDRSLAHTGSDYSDRSWPMGIVPVFDIQLVLPTMISVCPASSANPPNACSDSQYRVGPGLAEA